MSSAGPETSVGVERQVDHGDRLRAHPVRTIVVLAGISAFGPLTTDLYLPALPEIGRSYTVPVSEVQLTLTACLVGLAAGQLVVGPLSDTYGRRRPLLIGLALFVVASLVCAVTTSIHALDVARLVQGLAGATGLVLGRAIVRDLYTGKAAGQYFSVLAAIMGVAPIVAPLLGGQLLRVIPWRGLFVVLAVIGVVLVASVAWWIPESLPVERRRRATAKATVRTFGRLVRDWSFIGFALSGGLAFASMFSYIAASSFVYQDIYGISPQGYSFLFGLNSAGIMCASIVNSRLLKRFSITRLLTIGLSLMATGGLALLVCVLAGAGVAGIVPSLFLAVSGIGMILPNTVALAMADHGTEAGSASALIGVIQFSAGGIMAPIVGLGGVSALPMAVAMAVLGVAAIITGRYAISRRSGRGQA